MVREVVFVGSEAHGLNGNGKMTQHIFLPAFTKAASYFGISVHSYDKPGMYMENVRAHAGAVFVLVYNEEWGHSRLMNSIHNTIISDGGAALVIHPPNIGTIVGDKEATYRTLSRSGVPMPGMANSGAIFSNSKEGSGTNTALLPPGSSIDPARYNTRFIDTMQHFKGKDYYVCLRAMCVGPEIISVMVRARDAAEGNPNVHAKDTPIDRDLLNHLYATIVPPRYDRLTSICTRAGASLGIGFYSHDILPDAHSDALYLCETGFKFDDVTLRERLEPIKTGLIFNDMWGAVNETKQAYSFLRQAFG